jgi:hypothetical protein
VLLLLYGDEPTEPNEGGGGGAVPPALLAHEATPLGLLLHHYHCPLQGHKVSMGSVQG